MVVNEYVRADLARLIIVLITEFSGRVYDLALRLSQENIDPATLDWNALLPRTRAELEAEVDATAPPEPPVA